jgi:hypothetical protein
MIDLSRKICKPVLKLDFTAHGLMESLSELQLRNSTLSPNLLKFKSPVIDSASPCSLAGWYVK